MRKVTLRIPEFGFILVTRAALAFGAGLLASARIPDRRRRMIGLALVAIGAATTVPAVIAIRGHLNEPGSELPG